MSDLSVYAADQFVDWLSQGTIASPPSSIYIAVFDDTNTERSTDFANNRVEAPASSGWTEANTGFENTNLIDFGEATTDVNNLQDVALYDAASGGNELARYPLSNIPSTIAQGSSLQFEPGNLTFDVLDRTE